VFTHCVYPLCLPTVSTHCVYPLCLCLQAASAELRELAAEGLGELVDITSEETLKPFVVQITGVLLLLLQHSSQLVHLP